MKHPDDCVCVLCATDVDRAWTPEDTRQLVYLRESERRPWAWIADEMRRGQNTVYEHYRIFVRDRARQRRIAGLREPTPRARRALACGSDAMLWRAAMARAAAA